MAQLFALHISDGNQTSTFYSSTQSGDRYQLADGGFQVGLPRTRRTFGVLRPGVGIMTSEERDVRECDIRFSIYATTRAGVMGKISQLNGILQSASQRARTGQGERVDLRYSWEGADKQTYLEVYGGELQYPDNLWSVEGMHAQIGGYYVIPNLVLKLWLSPDAYAISLRSTSMTAVPLSNSYGSGNTTGLKVVMTGTNYVEIAGSAIDGDTPVPAKISIDPGDSNFSTFYQLFMGLQRQLNGYPSNLHYDSKNIIWTSGGGTYSGGYGGNHIKKDVPSALTDGLFGSWSWEYNNTKGLFYCLVHNYSGYGGVEAEKISHAIGYSDFVTYGIFYRGDWFKSQTFDGTPLGVIQMPPGPSELAEKGTFHEDLWITLFTSVSDSVTVKMDYLNFLPIGDGMRIWRVRKTTGGGTAVDDGWEGIQYLDSGSKIWTPFYGILAPIKLVPGVNQRLYFDSIGATSDDHIRQIKVQVDYVPTYTTMVD